MISYINIIKNAILSLTVCKPRAQHVAVIAASQQKLKPWETFSHCFVEKRRKSRNFTKRVRKNKEFVKCTLRDLSMLKTEVVCSGYGVSSDNGTPGWQRGLHEGGRGKGFLLQRQINTLICFPARRGLIIELNIGGSKLVQQPDATSSWSKYLINTRDKAAAASVYEKRSQRHVSVTKT